MKSIYMHVGVSVQIQTGYYQHRQLIYPVVITICTVVTLILQLLGGLCVFKHTYVMSVFVVWELSREDPCDVESINELNVECGTEICASL